MSDLSQNVIKANWTFPDSCKISDLAKDFCSNLIVANPSHRMKARDALEHDWIRTMVPPEYLEYLYVVEQEAWGWQRSVRRKINSLANNNANADADEVGVEHGLDPQQHDAVGASGAVGIPFKRWDSDPLLPPTPTWMDIKLPPTPPPAKDNPEAAAAYRSMILDELDDGVPFGSSMHDHAGPDGVATSAAASAGAQPVLLRRSTSGSIVGGNNNNTTSSGGLEQRGRTGRPTTPGLDADSGTDLPDLSSGFASNIQNAIKRLNSIGSNLTSLFHPNAPVPTQVPGSPAQLDRDKRPASPSARFQEQADAFEDTRRRSRSRSIDLSSLSSAQGIIIAPVVVTPTTKKSLPFAGILTEQFEDDVEESWRLPGEDPKGRRMSTGSLSSLEDGL